MEDNSKQNISQNKDDTKEINKNTIFTNKKAIIIGQYYYQNIEKNKCS